MTPTKMDLPWVEMVSPIDQRAVTSYMNSRTIASLSAARLVEQEKDVVKKSKFIYDLKE